MITENFNSRTMANLEVALEVLLPTGNEKHASKIIECANHGDTTLSRLTGYAGRRDRVTRKERSRRLRPPNSLIRLAPSANPHLRDGTGAPSGRSA
jgi:hypothetical protein